MLAKSLLSQHHDSIYRQNKSLKSTQETDQLKGLVCLQCHLAFSISEDLIIHIKNAHSKLERNEAEGQEGGGHMAGMNMKPSRGHKLQTEA